MATLRIGYDPILGSVNGSLLAVVDNRLAEVNCLMGPDYETVAASQTDQILGSTGAVGDWLDGILIVPATLSPGAVSIKDGDGSSITIFTGGGASIMTLHSFYAPFGAVCVNTATPGWKVTTGANVSVICVGSFT